MMEEYEYEQWKPLKYPGIYKPVWPRFDKPKKEEVDGDLLLSKDD